MINRVQYSPSFQKKLVAKVNLPTQNGVENCSIYELDKGRKDAKQLKKQINKNEWEYYQHFLENVRKRKMFPKVVLSTKTFSLEDSKENCLGLVSSYDFGTSKNISYLEVNPKCQSSVENRPVKRVGEALVSFVMKMWNDKNIVVLHPLDEALGFYKKVGFTPMEIPVLIESPCYLNNEKLSETLKRNEEKLGSEIELVGEND